MIKWNSIKFIHYNIKLINDLTVSKFVTRKLIEEDDLLSGQHSAMKN